MNNKKKIHILTGLVCVAVIVIVSIAIYSHINKKQAITSEDPPLKTAKSLSPSSSSNDTGLATTNNTGKNQSDAGQKAASNQIQTQETA